MIIASRCGMMLLVGLSVCGCRLGSGATPKLELVRTENLNIGQIRKEFAIERGYRWEAMKDSVSTYVQRDWPTGNVDTTRTEWAFYAKKSPWRIAGWDEADPEELTAEDKVAYIVAYRVRDHYRWRRQTWLVYKQLSCEEAVSTDRTFPTSWIPCDSFPIVRDVPHHQ